MRRTLIILLSILLAFSLSAQKKKNKEPDRQPDQIDMFLHRIDTTHELNISAMNRVINYGYPRFVAHAEWMLTKSETREDMAYWEWFSGYLKIMSRKDMEGGFVHVEKALNLTRDSGDFRIKLLELEVKYYDHSREYRKELLTLDEINRVTANMTGKPSFSVFMQKAKLLQYLEHQDAASDCFSQAIATGASDSTALAEAYYNRGIIKLKHLRDSASNMADSISVMSDIERAALLDSNNVRYLYEHARLCDQWYDTMPEYRAKIEHDCQRILLLDTMPNLSSIRHCALALLKMQFEAERWIDHVMANFGENEHNWVYIYYNKAYIYALLNDKEGAMKYLDEAEQHGGISCKKLENDGNFYNLWRTDEFEELLLRVCMQ